MPRPEIYWNPDYLPKTDVFGEPVVDEFVNGLIRGKNNLFGFASKWGIMTPASFATHGYGRLGTGFGQRYRKQPDGRWLKVEG